jgi:hypothetical protein
MIVQSISGIRFLNFNIRNSTFDISIGENKRTWDYSEICKFVKFCKTNNTCFPSFEKLISTDINSLTIGAFSFSRGRNRKGVVIQELENSKVERFADSLGATYIIEIKLFNGTKDSTYFLDIDPDVLIDKCSPDLLWPEQQAIVDDYVELCRSDAKFECSKNRQKYKKKFEGLLESYEDEIESCKLKHLTKSINTDAENKMDVEIKDPTNTVKDSEIKLKKDGSLSKVTLRNTKPLSDDICDMIPQKENSFWRIRDKMFDVEEVRLMQAQELMLPYFK